MADPSVPPRFGALLQRLRTEASLTQAQLAERARLSQRGLQDLERGIHQAPHQSTLDLLATALGLSAQDRLTFHATAQAPPAPLPSPAPVSPRAPVAPDALAPLVGRAAEVAALDCFLAGAGAAGVPDAAARVLLLAGEPGMGKTRLLQAAAQHAIPRGWTVLVGGCQRRGGEDPYAPVLTALAHHIGLREPEGVRAALAGCAWLVRLLPELAGALEPLPAVAVAPQQERRLIHAAVARVLTNVAGPAGTLLVLDDLQWAGPDALDLIETLARTCAAVRLVGAYRDTEAPDGAPLGLLLADLARAGLVRHHALGPLAHDEAAALLADLLADTRGDGGLADRVLRRAGGTPLFLVSYAQAVRQGGVDAVPWDLAQGVRQRAAVLPEAARLVLGAAAVVGRCAARGVLMAVVGQPEEVVLAGLEAACRARLLLEEGEDGYVFAHDVIREVLEADLSAARRALLHHRVAAALAGDPAGAAPELLAFHYGRGGAWEEAMRYLEGAGDQAWSQRAHGAAEGHYRAALERLERLERARDALRVREKLGEMFFQTGRYAEAAAMWGLALEAYRAAGEVEGLGRVAARLAWAHARQGAPDAGLALLAALPLGLAPDAQRGTAPSPSLGVAAALHVGMAVLLLTSGHYDEALDASGRASALACASGDARAIARANGLRVDLLDVAGRLGDALALGHETLPLAMAADDPDVLLRLHRNLAHVHARRGDLAASRALLARALEIAARLGDPAQRAYTLALGALVAVVAGDWADTRAALDEAAALLRADARSWYAPYIPGYRALLDLVMGDRVGAAAAVAQAEALLAGSSNLQARRTATAVAAELDLLAERPGAAATRLAPLLDQAGLEESDVTELLPILARAQLEQGRVAEAEATVRRALVRARREGMRPALAEALRVQALIALRQKHWAEAAHSLEEGLELARTIPYPYAEARLLYLDGLLHVAQGEHGLARAQLTASQTLVRRLGAREEAARVDQALASLSQNRPPSTPEP